MSSLGWKCLYVPEAVAYHRRRNLPDRRRRMSALINYHSVKNRFLLRINNQTPSDLVATFLPTLARDIVVLGACLTIERTSLPAFTWLWRNRKRLWAKRREIQRKIRARRRMFGDPRGVSSAP
jgi:GT2 family glycosyltransferase